MSESGRSARSSKKVTKRAVGGWIVKHFSPNRDLEEGSWVVTRHSVASCISLARLCLPMLAKAGCTPAPCKAVDVCALVIECRIQHSTKLCTCANEKKAP